MSAERISLSDNTLIAGYVENIQRYEFALQYRRGKRVLDAGCGSGYGAHFLATNGAKSVIGLDISEEAIREARGRYRLDNLSFEQRDIETLEDDATLKHCFDVAVNFESVAHLKYPERMIRGIIQNFSPAGTLVISTPNGEISPLDEQGRPRYEFHHRVYNAVQFKSLVAPHFARVSYYAQWHTYSGKLRNIRAKELFEQLCEAYYNPMARVGRAIKRLVCRRVAGPPRFSASSDLFVGDYEIRPLEPEAYPWPPIVLLAVCEK